MKNPVSILRWVLPEFVAGFLLLGSAPAPANPTGGTVLQGSAAFSSQGSQLTIHTSDRAFINWQNFNIGVGETTSFVQPSSSSLVWNQISDPNPSQILGNLNANGYVVLQNQSGFYIGGKASITAHGLLMTTAPIPMPDLSSGGPWDFKAPPPTASIVNYGAIATDKGGSVFLLAHDIDNHGSITAPGGDIGLYAGKEVLLSSRPDGRGLSAEVTLPEGSVNNSGQIVADAGTIAIHAQVVNEGGLVQANSVRDVNGAIELVASDAVNLGPSSVISAKGDSQGTSAGGNITIKSSGTYSDQPGALIDISGGAQGGNGGQVEISAPQMSALEANIDGQAAPGFLDAKLSLDPLNIVLSSSGSTAPASGNVGSSDPPGSGTLTLNVNSFAATLSQISLQAVNNIEVSTVWNLPDSTDPNAKLTLEAGNNITLDPYSAIAAGKNWSINLIAGTQLTSAAGRTAGNDGIYLKGSSYVQSQNGNIAATAGSDVIIDPTSSGPTTISGIRTLGGGSIDVTATFGDVNTGANPQGFTFRPAGPYYSVSQTLGGISTAAGGDVTITAAGNITSFLPYGTGINAIGDAGSGAFGPEPGDVFVTAGGSIFGHFVLANGTGTLEAGQNVGGPVSSQNVALSLIKGSWTVDAQAGSIYLEEVRNPNGAFNAAGRSTSPGRHFFDYAPDASVTLDAPAGGVYLTALNLPRSADAIGLLPVIMPPTLDINSGPGGVVLGDNITLFPSPDGELNITTTGSMIGNPNNPGLTPTPELLMSDSGATRWIGLGSFGDLDLAKVPPELNNPNPVKITVSGDMNNLILNMSKQTQIIIGGDMIGCSFFGQNLHPTDKTSIDVTGQIFNRSPYSFVFLSQALGSVPSADMPPNNSQQTWYTLLDTALDPAKIGALQVPLSLSRSQWAAYAAAEAALLPTGNPGFVYNTTTRRLGFDGQMSQSVRGALEQPLTVLRYGPDGYPIVDSSGHFVTDQVTWAPASAIETLYQASLGAPDASSPSQLGYRLGGPGEFDISAGSINLGNSYGILSFGAGDRFSDLAAYTRSGGATINVVSAGDINLITSTIAAMGGGDVNVTSTGGAIDLGSQELFSLTRNWALGVYTSARGNVSVTAQGDINIDGSRIAAYDGGSISVTSLEGNVNAGSGGTTFVPVSSYFVDPRTGQAGFYDELVFGSGIVANTLVKPQYVPGSANQPGNISVTTPQGNIEASLGGIVQEALNGNVSGGPTVNLKAGSPGHPGNIDLGQSGVIGGSVNLDANGNISGLVISRQNSTINAAQSFSGTVLSGGTANLTAGGNISGTVVGVGGVSASGGSVSAALLSQNVSVGGAQAQSTLGTSATATTASQSAAQQANSQAQEQVASNNTDDEDQKKKKGKQPALLRRVGRVTVILPPAS